MISKQVKNKLAMMLGDDYETAGDLVLMANTGDKSYDIVTSTGEKMGLGNYKAVKYFLGPNGFIYFCVTSVKAIIPDRTNRNRKLGFAESYTEVHYELYNSKFECLSIGKCKATGYFTQMVVQIGRKLEELKLSTDHNGFYTIKV